MTLAPASEALFRPPGPTPHDGPIGVLRTILALRPNTIEIWTGAHYEQPILSGRTIMGERAARAPGLGGYIAENCGTC